MSASAKQKLYSSFWLADRWYGIEVMRVQEVTRPLAFTPVPLAPPYVKGLINLRGQLATLVDLRSYLGLGESMQEKSMFVFCQAGGQLIALLVDQIGDVVETHSEQFETTPEVLAGDIRAVLGGIYKIKKDILSVLDMDAVSEKLLSQKI